MTIPHEWLADLSSRFWPLALNHLWQSTLFVLAVLPMILLLRRSPARVRYSLCLVASAKFVLPSAMLVLVLAPLGLSGLPGSSVLRLDFAAALASWFSGGAAAPGATEAGGHLELYCVLSLVWFAGALLLGGGWLLRQRRFARTLAGARRVSAGPEAELLEQVRRRLGIRRRIVLAMLPGTVEPGVWRVLRPVLILPEEMPGHLSPAELEALFLHELIHVRRWDNLVATVHMLVCCAFWFHPVVWLLDRRLLAEREEACDERVVELCGRADTYARGLLKAVRFAIGWRLAGVSSASASNFLRRIERIRSGVGRRTPTLADRGFLGAVLALLMVFSVAAGAPACLSADRGVPAVWSERAAAPEAEGCDRREGPRQAVAAREYGFKVPEAPPSPTGEPCRREG